METAAMELLQEGKFAILVFLALASLTCGRGIKSGSDAARVLPDSGSSSAWKLVNGPTVISTEADLYNRIDGGAPKYIERGWISSSYAEYRNEATGTSLQSGIHDMGSPAGAETMFKATLPAARTEISYTGESPSGDRQPNAVLDLHLSGTYAAYGFSDRYYIELNTDAKSEVALEDVKAFMLKTLEKPR
jgi:hypothetical protein